MRPIKIIQVDTPMFEYEGEEYYVDTHRYLDFCHFQEQVDRMIDMGATHCFMYTVSNMHGDDMIISMDGKVTDAWIRCRFRVIDKYWCVYMVKCSDGSIYTGITNDLNKRTSDHNLGKGAKYTKSRLPVRLKRVWRCKNRSEASKLEHKLKKLTREEKLEHIREINPREKYLDKIWLKD